MMIVVASKMVHNNNGGVEKIMIIYLVYPAKNVHIN